MTDSFIDELESAGKQSLSATNRKAVRRCLADYIACTIAGSRMFHERICGYLGGIGQESGDATVIGVGTKSSMQTAALVNGMSSHVAELDDGHRRGALHVGGTVFSALLAVAERNKLSSRDVVIGATVGYEATIRLACAVQPGNKLRGYHATGTCGTVGATAAVCAALDFDRGQMRSALSAAVAGAAGVLEMQEDGSELKPFNVGRAALDGIAAAYIGMARFVPPIDAIGGRRGFLAVMTDTPHPEFLSECAQGKLAIGEVYMKTYAACRHAHPAIEAALALRGKIADVSRIAGIRVRAYRLAVAGHDHVEVSGVSSSKMSIPFGVALALVRGAAGMDEYTAEAANDRQILVLARKVFVAEDAELTALVPGKRASIVEVIMDDGTIFNHRVDYPKGEPENPLSDDELESKFMGLARYARMDSRKVDLVLEELAKDDFDVCRIMDLIR